MIGLMSIFPNSNMGLEIACIIMLATGQAWNMTFSFYYSLKAVPQDLNEATSMMRLNWFQKLLKLEMPYSAIGLAWNSLMSMAGGWFFLTVCESFTLEGKNFHLPGLGSYMALAIESGNTLAMVSGVIAMALVILFCDFIVWRPVLSWVQKFQMEENTSSEDAADMPFVTYLLQESRLYEWVRLFRRRMRSLGLKRLVRKAKKKIPYVKNTFNAKSDAEHESIFKDIVEFFERHANWISSIASHLVTPLTILFLVWSGTRVWELIRTLDAKTWIIIWKSVGFTGVRIFGAVFLSTLWTVPFAIYIGQSQRLIRIFQPVVQLAASFPAPMLYPLVLTVMFSLGIHLRWGAMLLMMFGVQWYVLFNVLAGATTISRDLKDSLINMRVSKKTMWKKLYLPSLFPALTTGWVNAAGGAWNASIVAEYIQYNKETLSVPGIGALICRATAAADFPKLAGCLIAMVITVVLLNRIFWNRICSFAENRFR